MSKYYIYGESERKPIRRTKHENDALSFVGDFKNLQRYGCMTVIRESDDGSRQRWSAEKISWEDIDE